MAFPIEPNLRYPGWIWGSMVTGIMDWLTGILTFYEQSRYGAHLVRNLCGLVGHFLEQRPLEPLSEPCSIVCWPVSLSDPQAGSSREGLGGCGVGIRHPRNQPAKEVKCPASCTLPHPSCPSTGVSLAVHLLHPVLRPSEQNEDVREKPKSDWGFCSPLMRFIISCSDPWKTQPAGLGANSNPG